MTHDRNRPFDQSANESAARVSRLRVGEEDLFVLSVPSTPLRYPPSSTQAERAVIDGLLEGLSTTEIAEQRGTSKRTVDVQLSAIFRKGGVNSQAELIAQMLKPQGDET